jgi:hypothetical protein
MESSLISYFQKTAKQAWNSYLFSKLLTSVPVLCSQRWPFLLWAEIQYIGLQRDASFAREGQDRGLTECTEAWSIKLHRKWALTIEKIGIRATEDKAENILFWWNQEIYRQLCTKHYKAGRLRTKINLSNDCLIILSKLIIKLLTTVFTFLQLEFI